MDSRLGFNNLIQFDEKIYTLNFMGKIYPILVPFSIFPLKSMVKIILKMCLETHVADETKNTTKQFLLEQCLNYIYQVQFH